MRLQRTPEPARVVVRLLRTTDPPRAHVWAMFLCEQKGGSAGGSPAKRLTSLAIAAKQRSEIKMGPRLRGDDEVMVAQVPDPHPPFGHLLRREKGK